MVAVLSLSWCTSMGGVAMLEEEVEPSSPEGVLVLLALAWPITALVVAVIAGVRGNHWRDNQAHQQGFGYVKTVPAHSAEAALAQLSVPKQSTTEA